MSTILHIIVILWPVLLRLALCYFVLRDKRVQETAMAWVLLMMFLPIAGFVLYLVFGKDYRTAKARRFIHGEARRRMLEEIPKEAAPLLFPEGIPEIIDAPFRPLARQNLACGSGNCMTATNWRSFPPAPARKNSF